MAIMFHLWLTAFVLQASLGLADDNDMGTYLAPGRADRIFAKRAPTDFGTFAVDCQGSEGACNNACYYIRCNARQDPDANKIVYIGPKGNNGEDDNNRIESGCNFRNPSSGSVCTNFPFSQKFSNPTATDYQCDEWPPALHQQPQPFGARPYRSSLRCIPGGENGSLGAKLGNFVNDKGSNPGRPAGVMNRDDFFRVDFLSNIGTADQTKVQYCLGQTPNCGTDLLQFAMTAKPVTRGKISSHYNEAGNDNRYALHVTVYDDLYQCGVQFQRQGNDDFQNVILSDWQNTEVQTTTSCSISNDGDTCTLTGLPKDLTVKRTGPLGSRIEFEYAPRTSTHTNINNFAWDSFMSGNGRGPWTDPETDPNKQPLRYCKVVSGPNTEDVECWFPCYKTANGVNAVDYPENAKVEPDD